MRRAWAIAKRGAPLFALIVGPILLPVHLLVRDAAASAEESARVRTLAIARLGGTAVNEYAGGVVEYVQAYSRRANLLETVRRKSPEEVRAILQEMVGCNARIDRVFVTDSAGVEWVDYPQDPSVIGKNFAFRDWFKGVTAARDVYVSHSYVRTAVPQKNAMAIAVPILNDRKEIEAICVAQMLVESLEVALIRSIGDWEGTITLVDREGQISATTRSDPRTASFLKDHPLNATEATVTSDLVVAVAPVPTVSGSVVATRGRSEAFGSTWLLSLSVYALASAFSVLLAGALFVLLESRSRRIEILKEQESHQRALSQRKSDFVAYLAHEIRSPLTAVLGFTDIILSGSEGDISQAVRTDLEIVKERAHFILALVSDLLDTTKIEAGRMEVRREEFEPGAVAKKIIESLEPIGRRRGIRLELADPPPGLQVLADPRQTEQVISNLLSNALKFTRQGSIRLSISGGREMCTVRVEDTGPGMGPEDLERIFERYATLHRDRSAVQRDTGLGLYLCRQLVELQGGKLWVESELGLGTRVSFTLPVPKS